MERPRLKKVQAQKQKPMYKNNMYRNGNIRTDISRQVLYEMASKYGDILPAISSTKWVTADEIADTYWRMSTARRTKNERGMPGICEALSQLVSSGLILEK
jgi:hypothetical protein